MEIAMNDEVQHGVEELPAGTLHEDV